MQSDKLPLYTTKNGNYISPKISKEKLQEMCKEYFNILIIPNENKKYEYDPDYVVCILSDK